MSDQTPDPPGKDDFLPADFDDRMEDKPPSRPDDAGEGGEGGEGGEVGATSRPEWGDRPTVRDQRIVHPHTIRLVHPTAVILDLSKSEDLDAYNKILRSSDDAEAPTTAITHCDRQFYEGGWRVFITYSKVQYQQL